MIDIELLKKLRDVAIDKIPHAYNGFCPDTIEGFDSRDSYCEACKIIIEVENIIAANTIKGCHVDYKNHYMKPSDWCIHKDCVYDYVKPDDCDVAIEVKSKEGCTYWREVEDFEYYVGYRRKQ